MSTHRLSESANLVADTTPQRTDTDTQVACGGYHTLAVCAHDSMQQEQAEKQRGYKQKVMQLFSKPVTVDVPDSRQHSSGPNTAGSGGITPLDRVSDGSVSLMNHGSNGTASSVL